MKRISLFSPIFWKGIARTSFHNKTTTICRPYYNGVKEELSDIKSDLQKYKGGSVDLEKKDNGICHVILNHPERRNALSGKIHSFLLSKYFIDARDTFPTRSEWRLQSASLRQVNHPGWIIFPGIF